MDEDSLAPVIQEIKGALQDMDEEKLREELNKYLMYGINLREARNAIIRKYGGRPNTASIGTLDLKDLTGAENNFDVIVRCMGCSERMLKTQNGEKPLVIGLLADRTMIRRFSSWEGHMLEKGRTYVIHGASARPFRGEVEISLGPYATFEEPEEDPLADLDVGGLPRYGPLVQVKLKDIHHGMGNVEVVGKIIGMEEKTITANDSPKRIIDGMMADETKRLRFTCWSELPYNVGDVIRVKGAYVKDWRGIPQVNFDERAEIDLLEDVEIDIEGSRRLNAEDLQFAGATDVEVRGVLIEIREGSGLIFRCPVCNRALTSGTCAVHSEQEGVPDLRVKVVIDDGTGSLFAVLNTEITEELLCMDVPECVRKYGTTDGRELIEQLNKRLLGRTFVLRGNVIKDDFGSTMLPGSISEDEFPYMDEVKSILETMEGY
ncbi:MAG: hypothetical protein QCI82_00205 [Candidatus Thermoplasmatota archaeon]|nr:hypothetical protein [Candidatus Thermoplasmatota archaeon]